MSLNGGVRTDRQIPGRTWQKTDSEVVVVRRESILELWPQELLRRCSVGECAMQPVER